MNSKRIGNIGEAKVLSEFVKWGIPVYIQFGDTEKADFIADFYGKLNRIQVKTTERLSKDKRSFCVSLCSITTKNGKQIRTIYDKKDVDYFAIYCIELDITILYPNDGNTESLCVRVLPSQNNQTKNIHNVCEYTFEKWFDRDVSPRPDKALKV